MVNENVRKYLEDRGFADRLTEHSELIDTVEHAAQQIGCTEAEIAKTLSFIVDDKPVIVVMAGDGRVNSSKFKAQFHTKPHMIPREQVEDITGFPPGGVWSSLRYGRSKADVHWTSWTRLESRMGCRYGWMSL